MTIPARFRTHDHDEHETPEWDRGLHYDVNTLLTRRKMFAFIGAGSILGIAGCSTTSSESSSPTNSSNPLEGGGPGPGNAPEGGGAGGEGTQSDGTIPEETAGPYPANGSNGVNVLDESGVVRSDIRSSFGDSAGGTAEGVPLEVNLTLSNSAINNTAYAGAAVYIWMCNRDGNYSMYSEDIVNENYLRGVQIADESGRVSFTAIFPAAYSGRWPHIHFQVFNSESDATSSGEAVATSQIALPQDICETVYATEGYEKSVRNLASISLDTDNVFSDGYEDELATVTGSVSQGYVASLDVLV